MTEPGVGTNRYFYSFNDPINKLDPCGNRNTTIEEHEQSAAAGGSRVLIPGQKPTDRTFGGRLGDLATPFATRWPARVEAYRRMQAAGAVTMLNGIAATFAFADHFDPLFGTIGILNGSPAYSSIEEFKGSWWMQLNIEETVKDALGPQLMAHKISTKLGWVTYDSPGGTPNNKSECSFNYPLEIDEIEYLKQFARDGHRNTIQSFYRACNGMRFYGSLFFVPGVLFSPSGLKGDDFINVATSVETLGAWGLPEFSPINGFVLGGGHFEEPESGTRVRYDIVDPEGKIQSGFFDTDAQIVDSFDTVQDWIVARINDARERFHTCERL